MERPPLYGGKRGIEQRTDFLVNLLRVFAKSDFKHDFGEGIPARDKYTQEDLQRFLEISQRFGISKVAALREGFRRVVGSNPYEEYNAVIPTEIYPSPGDGTDYQKEEAILQMLSIQYGPQIKDKIKQHKLGKTDAWYLNNPYVGSVPVVFGGQTVRTYSVTAGPLKVDGNTPNIATLFNKITGNNQFALVIDAAGGLSLTAMQDAGLEPYDPAKQYRFFIIENIENDADSATKIKHLDKSRRLDVSGKPTTNVQVIFMKDNVQSVVYEPFSINTAGKPTLDSQTESLFGNAKMVLSRIGEETEADFIYPNQEEYHIENVSQNANVKNASLNMLASRLAGRGRESFLYAYLKRVGDWCQALSLLDSSREYTAFDVSKQNIIAQLVTLKALQDQNVTVALVTLDRILLAFALLLGIDVIFTTGQDITSLIYFKNTEIVLTGLALKTEIERLKKDLDTQVAAKAALPATDFDAEIQKRATILSSNTHDVRFLRSFFSNVTMMTFDFATIQRNIDSMKYNGRTDDPQNITILNDLIVAHKKYIIDYNHNIRLLSSIDARTYPDFVVDKEALTIARPSRNAIAKLGEIISKKLKADVVQVKKLIDSGKISKKFTVDQLIPKVLSPSMTPTVRDAFPAFSVILAAVSPMKGGGPAEIVELLKNLAQFQVTPTDVPTYKGYLALPASELAEIEDSQAPIVIQYSYYRDASGFPYTVFDTSLITVDDVETFRQIYAQVTTSPPAPPDIEKSLAWASYRFLLLYSDILRGRYERMIDSEDDVIVEAPVAFGYSKIESEIKFSEHQRIHYHASQLKGIIDSLPTNGYIMALGLGLTEYLRIDKLDNESLSREAVGRGQIRYNDYKRTCDLIETCRLSLLSQRGVTNVPFTPCQEQKAVKKQSTAEYTINPDTGEREKMRPQPKKKSINPMTRDEKIRAMEMTRKNTKALASKEKIRQSLGDTGAPAFSFGAPNTGPFVFAAPAPAPVPPRPFGFAPGKEPGDISMNGSSRSKRTPRARKRNGRKTRRGRKPT